jgi:ketosteroid isomerase-like protein
MVDGSAETTRRAVLDHIESFNNHDTAGVLRGLAPDVVWVTGTDAHRGRSSLLDVFDDWLWSLNPHLEIARLIAEGSSAALECVETLVVDGRQSTFRLAVFFDVCDGLLASVKVFREGTAQL